MTKNYSQEQDTPKGIRPITSDNIRRPGTVGVGTNNRRIQKSIDSTIQTHKSKGDSIQFNNEEIQSLMEVFSIFDKKKTGFVNEDDLLRIIDIMNKDSQKIQERIEDIKNNDENARQHSKFTFQQFLRIVGKMDVGDHTTQRSGEGEYTQEIVKEQNLRNMNKKFHHEEMQQSENFDKEDLMNKEIKENKLNITNISSSLVQNPNSESQEQQITPRLQSNILVKKQNKESSLKRSKVAKINPSQSHKMGFPKISSDPPMNLMQFRGVRVNPDKKVLDILSILNNYRKD